MESWSGFLSGIYSVIVALRGQELVLIHQFLVNAYFYEALSFYSLNVSFAMCRSHTSIKICIFVS